MPYGTPGYAAGALPSDAPRHKVVDLSTGFDPGAYLPPADLAEAARQRRQNLGAAAVVARGVARTAAELTGAPAIIEAARKGQVGSVIGQAALFGIPGGKLLEAGAELTRVARAARAAGHIKGDERNAFIQTIHANEPNRKNAQIAIAKVDAYVHTQVKELPRAERAAAAQKAYARIHRAVPIPHVPSRIQSAHAILQRPTAIEALTPEHGDTIGRVTRAQRSYDRARNALKKAEDAGQDTGVQRAAFTKAKTKLGNAKNDELYTRLRAQSTVTPESMAAHPNFNERQGLAERLVDNYAGRRGALPDGMKSPLAAHHVLAHLDELTDLGAHGKLWYERSAKAILDLARGDKGRAEKIAQLLAIYSPQQPILGNTSLAFRAYNDFLTSGGKVLTGQRWQKEAAERVLSGKGDWNGRKTNNFYVNFLEDIDPEKFHALGFKGDEVTSDLWMARALGYKTDAVSEGRYDIIESTVRQIAKERGWKPKQVQAAIWTAIKHASDDRAANIDFATGFERHLAQINYEAAIGTDPELRAAYDTWDGQIQQAFMNHKAVLVDRFTDEVGLLSSRSGFGPGVWEEELAPGAQLKVGTSAAPRLARGKVSYRLPENERDLLTVTSGAIARALKQDSAAWVRPFKPLAKGAEDLIKVRLGRGATDEEAHGLASELGGDFAVIHTDDGLLVKQIGDNPLPVITRKGDNFHTVVGDAAGKIITDDAVKLIGYAHDGDLAESANYESQVARAFGNRRGSGEGLRFVEAADRFSSEADAVDAAYLANPERAARTSAELSRSRNALHEAGSVRFHDPHALAHGIAIEPPPTARPPEPVPVEAPVDPAAPVAASPASGPRVRRATHGPKTIEQAVTDALHGAAVSRHEQQALRTPENARRLEEYGKAVQEDPTAAGHAAAKKLLAGKYPTLHWGNFEEFNEDAADAMHKFIVDHPAFEGWIKVHAQDAIDKARSGVTPTRYEEKALRQFFGPDVTNQIMRSVPGFRKLKARLYDIANIPRAVMASFDVSGAGRQGLMIGTQHPGIWAKNLPGMFKALGSKDFYHSGIQEIHSRPNALNGIYDKMGLELTDLSDLGSTALREEAFATPYADKIPGVKMSARAYHYFLDKARADLADHLYAKAQKRSGKLITRIRVVDGKPKLVKEAIDPDDPELLKSIGDLVNSSSGRGDLGEGAIGRSADGLNLLLFSPRLAKSRIDFLNPLWYAKLHPLARQQAYRAMGGLVVMMATVLGIAKAAGASVNLDPRSSDFAKVKIGNTRLDFGGGFQQYIRVLSELATQQTVKTSTGETVPMGPWRTKPGIGKTDNIALLIRFLRGKLAPIPATVWNVGSGENIVGDPTTARSTLMAMAPLSGQDAWEAAVETARQTGSTPAAVLAGLAAYGFGASGGGIQSYVPRKPKVPSSGGFGSGGFGGGGFGSGGFGR